MPLASGAYVTRDTLFLPLQWLTDYVPRVFHGAYPFDPLANRFEEVQLAPVIRSGPVAHAAAGPGAADAAAHSPSGGERGDARGGVSPRGAVCPRGGPGAHTQ